MRSRALLLALTLYGCGPKEVLDTTRRTQERGTLGREIYRLLAADLEREAPRKAQGFALEEAAFVGAVDHLFRPDELAYVQSFLLELLPLYDDGTFAANTRPLADLLERLVQDPLAAQSLAAMNHRSGYVDLRHEEALIRRIARYPEYPRLARALLALTLQHDGLDQDGQRDPGESDALTRLLAQAAEHLRTLEISADTERGLVLAADFLLQEDARLREASPALGLPLVVRRDVRGVAQVNTSSGRLPAPFSDSRPADGLADIDDLGRFVSGTGEPLELSPFGVDQTRDSAGRLIGPDGRALYAYVELDDTILAGLLRDGRRLMDQGVPMKAVRSVDKLLGQRLPDGGYGAANSPLLELAHAGVHTLNTPELPDVLELLRVLLEEHQATTTWSVLEMKAQLELADRHAVALRPGSTFFNDLLSVVRKILREPGLAEALLVALRDPAVRQLPAVQARLIRHKKERITAEDVAQGRVFTTAVDRSRGDVAGNQSLLQRTLHLIHDTKGARYVPSFIGVPIGFIFQIDDLAEFYLLSIIGESSVPSLVATLTGLSTRPTPQELAVFINEDQTFGNPQGHEGIDVKDNDGDTLFAATASGMTDVLRPLIRCFHDRGQLRLLFELFEVLHKHWASVDSDYQDQDASRPRYSKLSGISRYEPLLVEIFEGTRVLDAALDLLAETEQVRASSGRRAHDLLLALGRKLLDKDGALLTREGKREVLVDGERITPLSPFDLLRGARARVKAVVRTSAASQADWDALVDAVDDTFLAVERTGERSGRLANPRALPVASAALSFFEERARRHRTAAELSTWLTGQLLTELEDAVTAPEVGALFDVIYAVDGDPELDATLGGLVDELFAEDQGFGDLLVTVADGLEAAKDASVAVHALRFLGRELDPSAQLLFRGARLAERSLELDEDDHLLELVRRAVDDAPAGGFYAGGLGRAIRQVHRSNPLQTGTAGGDDVLSIARGVGRYLLDEEHGLEKFYDVVKRRKLEGTP